MIGNLPCASSDGWMRTPWMEPLNSSPSRPWMAVTDADSVRTKSPGVFSMSAHWMPISSILTGRNDGHLNESPVAEPIDRNTPKPVPRAERAVAEELEVAGFTAERQRSDVDGRADRLERQHDVGRAGRARVEPEVAGAQRDELAELDLERVDRQLERVDSALVKVSAMRNASVSGVPSGRLSSAVRRSVSVAENGLPGNSLAPPVAMKILPVKSPNGLPAPIVTVRPEMPTRMSSSSRMPPKRDLLVGRRRCELVERVDRDRRRQAVRELDGAEAEAVAADDEARDHVGAECPRRCSWRCSSWPRGRTAGSCP